MAGQRFKKVWRIQNRGEVQWTGRKLRCVDAELVVARWEETRLAAGVGGGVFSEVDSDAEGSGDCVDGTGTHGRDRCHIQSVSCLATRFLAGRWWMRRVSGAFRNTAGFGARCRWWRFRVCLPRFIAWSTKCVLTMQSPLPMPPPAGGAQRAEGLAAISAQFSGCGPPTTPLSRCDNSPTSQGRLPFAYSAQVHWIAPALP